MGVQALSLEQRTHDISPQMLHKAVLFGRAACDLETSGLNWSSDTIATFQMEVAGELALVQLDSTDIPANISKLVENPDIRKVFHHAPFDLRFMVAKWGVNPANVACTKIAAKIIQPGMSADSYTLKSSLRKYLDIDIDKTYRLSNWSETTLSTAQVEYAVTDVRYLNQLLDVLESHAERLGVMRLIAASYAYLPTRVELDMKGSLDVFTY